MELFNLENVFYEESSEYKFSELSESIFIEKIFMELKKELGKDFFCYKFYIFSNHRGKKLPDSYYHKNEQNKILIYLSDENGRSPDTIFNEFIAVFKSYLGDTCTKKNVFPFPLGYVNGVRELPIKPVQSRPINVYYSGNLNMNRINFYRTFSKLKPVLPSEFVITTKIYRKFLLKLNSNFSDYFENSIIVFNEDFKSGFSREVYSKHLSDSKIVLCPKGYYKTESFRHFEAMRAGCIVVSEKLPDTPFYTNSPIIQIENWNEGINLVKNLLKDEQKMAEFHIETVNWWNEKCSEKATAKFIASKLELAKV